MSSESIDEAMLFAYVDGELDAAQRARVEAAVAGDPRLAAMLARQKQLKSRLRMEFDPVLDEPVPGRLLRAAQAPASATVVDLHAARESRAPRAAPRWALREWGAVAATLALGLLVGLNLPRGTGDASLVAGADGMVAGGALATALSERPAGAIPGAGARIGFSIRADNGEMCRSFALESGAAGLACRRAGRWAIDVLAAGDSGAEEGTFRQAGSELPAALRVAIEQRITGEPLSEDQELEQIGRQWEGTSPPASGR